MNKILYTLLAFFLFAGSTYGQLVITDSLTTPSLCFNTGSIQVAATGGTGPYTFTITGGPSYPNITYPISLPPLSNTFLTMPKGEYTIKVVDANGTVSFATATVAGNYEFPVLTPTIDNSYCIEVSVQFGKPPYQYAISSTSSSAGFGPYQPSNIFCVCTGHYWVRVLDSCSNIFTTSQVNVSIPSPIISATVSTAGTLDSVFTSVNSGSAPPYTYHLKSGSISITNSTGIFAVTRGCNQDTVTLTDRCGVTAVAIINPHPLTVGGLSDCNTGDAILTIDSAALAPFVITGSGITGSITTHSHIYSLSGLPIGTAYTFTITDSCGHTTTISLPCQTVDTLFFYDVCPFDSSLHLTASVHYCFPLIATCLSCVPVQIDTVTAVPARIFHNIDTGVLYTVNLKDNCGFNYTTQYTPHYSAIPVTDSIFTCRDFALISTPRIFVPPIHYTIYEAGTFYDSVTANDPFFYHVPAANYTVTATQPLCYQSTLSFSLPNLGGRCIVPMYDSSCTPSYAVFQLYMSSSEVFSLVNTSTSQTYTEFEPRGTSPALLFANVPVGTYNLVSDSGCTLPYQLPAYHYAVSVVTSTQCTGQSKIVATAVPPVTSCNTSQGPYYKLLMNNQLLQSNTSGIFIVADTGDYVVQLFLSNTTIFNFPATYDTICPLDTILFHVSVNPIPNVVSVQQFVCGNQTANIPYTIFGGSEPYTVDILGYPTRTISTTKDTFPNVLPGIYTMVVSDSCGISRSFSVSVVDTCTANCTDTSRFGLSATEVCRGSIVMMNNLSTGATHFRWYINGALYAYIRDTSFTTNIPGTYTIKLYSYVGTCVDSSQRSIIVDDSLSGSGLGIGDTALCPPIDLRYNTHNAQSQWSTGVTDSVVTITSQGTYWVQVSNICGTIRDSFKVTQKAGPVFALAVGGKDTLCYDRPDSTVLTAALLDSSGHKVVFNWSTGYVDSLVYSSGITVYQAGNYTVLVSDSFCPQTRSITVDSVSCDSICLAGIGIPDAFSPNGDNKNDTFRLPHLCPVEPFEMHIYNKWGELVFTSDDIDKGWDGKYKGKPQPEGIYWLWLSLSINGGKAEHKSGTVTLVK